MDDTSPCASGNSGATMHCSSAFSEDHDRVDELRSMLLGQLKITNDGRRVPVERNDLCDDDDEEEEEEEDDFSEEDLLVQMGYAKSDPRRDYDVAEEEEDEKEGISEDSTFARIEPPKHQPVNTPIAELNLVSAFKGSREKEEGRPGKGCRVSWAPDVYDPPCTSDDHFTESSWTGSQKGTSSKNRQKGGGGKRGGEVEGRGGGGRRSRGGGSSRGNEGGSKAGGGGGKDRKKAEKKHKKRGDSGQ